MNEQIEVMPPQNTWFFTDSTGRIFSANEEEAFKLLTNTNRWRRQDIRMIGMSDGRTYQKVISESKSKTRELSDKVAEKKQLLNKYVEGHDKLMFEQMLEETDPRMIRAKKMIQDIEAELAPMEKELRDLRTNIVQVAFDAELEKARGNMVNPRDKSVIAKSDGTARGNAFMQQFAQSKRVL